MNVKLLTLTLAITGAFGCADVAVAGGEYGQPTSGWGSGGGGYGSPTPTTPPPPSGNWGSPPPAPAPSPVPSPAPPPTQSQTQQQTSTSSATATAKANAVANSTGGSSSLQFTQSLHVIGPTVTTPVNVTVNNGTGTGAAGSLASPAAQGAAVGALEAAATRQSSQTVVTQVPSYPVNPSFAPNVQNTAPCTQGLSAAVTTQWISVAGGVQYDILPICQLYEKYRVVAAYDQVTAMELLCEQDPQIRAARETLGLPCGQRYVPPVPQVIVQGPPAPAPAQPPEAIPPIPLKIHQ